MDTPFIGTRMFVPVSWVSNFVLETILTVYPHARPEDEPKPPIPLYDAESYDGYVGVPIDWGVRHFMDRGEIEDRTEYGTPFDTPNRADPYHESVQDPEAQKAFMEDLLTAAEEEYAVLAIAPTGSGKTVVSLNTAAELGRSTLVVVPTIQIAKQWRTAAIDIFGMEPDDIGMVQGNKCEYNKKLCIGIVNSVAGHDYPIEFYHAFGTVIWDEIHKYATQKFSQTLFMFPATHKIALTATAGERKDRADDIYMHQLGRGQVVSTARALPIKVHVISYNAPGKVYGHNDRNVAFMCLARDQARNDLLLGIITKLYEHGRTVLGVGESIDHIEYLIGKLREGGIPEAEIGQFTASHTNDRGYRAKTDDTYLHWCRKRPSIILGTYGMLKEGTDIPRLDAGVELTPRTDATQLLGRVRRPMTGKPKPLWYSILDRKFGMFHGFLKAREKDYHKDPNIEVIKYDR